MSSCSSSSVPTVMKGYRVTKHAATGDYSQILQLSNDLPVPTISDNQVLVQVAASSVNPVDVYILRGYMDSNAYFPRKLPYVAGYDCSGTVVKVGAGVKSLKVGDAVFGSTDFHNGSVSHGSWAQYAPGSESLLTKKPANVSFEEAAAVPVAGSSAYEALVSHGELKPGDRVLVLGGAGGVGSYGIQIARALGAGFIATTCSPANADFVRSLGADEVIDYHTQDWAELYSTAAAKQFDLVVDYAGGKIEWERAQKAVKKEGGRFITICGDRDGNSAPDAKNAERANAVPKYRGVLATCSSSVVSAVGELMAAGKVKTIINSTFSFKDAAKACAKVETRKVSGKIVLTGPIQ